MRLEGKSTADYVAQLDAKLKLKQKELEAHASLCSSLLKAASSSRKASN
jgi:hypothetical protein